MLNISLSPERTNTGLHCSAPLCTPPMPPVTNIGMPAALAKIIVLATVVAPALFCVKRLDQYQVIVDLVAMLPEIALQPNPA